MALDFAQRQYLYSIGKRVTHPRMLYAAGLLVFLLHPFKQPAFAGGVLAVFKQAAGLFGNAPGYMVGRVGAGPVGRA